MMLRSGKQISQIYLEIREKKLIVKTFSKSKFKINKRNKIIK